MQYLEPRKLELFYRSNKPKEVKALISEMTKNVDSRGDADERILENFLVEVHTDVVGAEDRINMEVFFAGEARNFFGRNILDELSRAAVVSRKRSAGIFKKQERR